MKKHLAALALACAVAVLGGCIPKNPASSFESQSLPPGDPAAVSGKMMPANLTEKEAQIAALLAPNMKYDIIDFELAHAVKTVRLNRYRLENGAWALESGSGQTLGATSGRIALITDNTAKKGRLTLQSEGGSSTITYDLPEDMNDAGMASAIGYLNELAEIVAEAEIPLQIQVFTTKNSLSTYGLPEAFEQPALYAQHDYEHVYAVTVTFSQKELGEGDGTPGPPDGSVNPPQASPDADVPTQASALQSISDGPSADGSKPIYAPLYPSFSPNVKTIPFDVINNTDRDLGTGDRYRLQRLENGVWVDLPRLPLPDQSDGPPPVLYPAISGPFWPPYTRTRLHATVDRIDGSEYLLYSLPLKTGAYRLIDEYQNVSTPFEITDAPSDRQRRAIEQLGKVPVFEGVTFSPHDFTAPFVCQGVISDVEASGVKLYVFHFPDEKEAQAVFEGIAQDGYAIPQYIRRNDAVTIWETREFNWEDTPHFYCVGRDIYLYCGDDAAILSALPDAVTAVNPADIST